MYQNLITYNEYGKMMDSLCNKLSNSDSSFDVIYGLPRGGLALAVHISHQLSLPLVTSIRQIEGLYSDKQILAVDDIMTNGHTFSRFIEFAKLKNIKYKTAVLCYKPNIYTPNFWEYEVSEDEWIIFPWELTNVNKAQRYDNIDDILIL